MNIEILLWLIQDGITSGAIYALLALALLLVFLVTRVFFVPQGELISFAALSFALLQEGRLPGTVYVLVACGGVAALFEITAAVREGTVRRLARPMILYLVVPVAVAAVAWWAAPRALGPWAHVLLVLALVVPLGPILYRVAYQPLADAPILVLFIVSMALHYALAGLGLVFFGAEGLRSKPFFDAQFALGPIIIPAQSLWVIFASLVIMAALWVIFERTLYGKALRAVAINRTGAQLVGIPTALSGQATFTLAALIGALSGILIVPSTTVYYDTGFIFGLKGFVGAILGGMASYPLAVLGAVGVGLLESFSSFWASHLKEFIIFTVIIPVLVWRSLASRHVEESEE